jgi:hypothetical protein
MYQQYAAVDVVVTISAGTDLAARLTNGWLPVGKYAPITEASMRQRGFEVQILPLYSQASVTGATEIFTFLPVPSTTAFQLVLNVRLCSPGAPGPPSPDMRVRSEPPFRTSAPCPSSPVALCPGPAHVSAHW